MDEFEVQQVAQQFRPDLFPQGLRLVAHLRLTEELGDCTQTDLPDEALDLLIVLGVVKRWNHHGHHEHGHHVADDSVQAAPDD